MSEFYADWREVPVRRWVARNFSPREIAATRSTDLPGVGWVHGNGSILVVPDALERLQLVRDWMGRAMFLSSAYRDAIYNALVGGAPLSGHKFGHAFDIVLAGLDRWALLDACRRAGFTGFGFYHTFLHVDCGRPRFWPAEGERLWKIS